ncbi:MAG: extracellular solute-binding protein [Leptolyngbyaceae cyanobacterium RU_5_1]|nr:extracellular solute-binding protein [Leptolyngbyaceae cyanobacterium RU_5_1]
MGQISRRSLLTGTAAWTMSQLLASCSSQSIPTLKVLLLRGSIPAQLLNEFRRQEEKASRPVNLDFSAEQQLQELFLLLQAWQQRSNKATPSSGSSLPSWIPFWGKSATNGMPDLVTLGDYWLGKAIQQGLLKPIDVSRLKNWSQLSQNPKLKELLTRNDQGQPDRNGQVWGVPYRIGNTVIAYRRDIFEQRKLPPPTDWSDLWRPDLHRRISLPDQAREVIGLTLKKLGKSYNTTDLAAVPNLEKELRSLQDQVKLYSSDAYLQPLLLEDTWLAVSWSTDVLPIMQRSPQIAAVVPKSGTALWADMWVHPTANPDALSSAATDWIDFCWQPAIANQLSSLTWTISPVLLGKSTEKLSEDLRRNPVRLPDTQVLQNGEFLQPLSEAANSQYEKLWQRIRNETERS